MYTFVFLWTPALTPQGEHLPHGVVFACFMTACMAGSALTPLLQRSAPPHRYMWGVYLVSALAMALPFAFHLQQSAYHTGAGESWLPAASCLHQRACSTQEQVKAGCLQLPVCI